MIKDCPQRIVLELTSACNLSCPMCPRNYIKDNNGYMSFSLWKKLIKEIASYSSESVVLPFWRGESLLHPLFNDFIEFALTKHSKIHIATNGCLLNRKITRVLSKCEFVTFSIHNELGYRQAREFLSIRKGKHPLVQVSFVKGENTIKKIYDNIISAKTLEGFDSVRIYEEHSTNGIFGKSKKASKEKRIFCPKLINTIVISYNGLVSRCNHNWHPEKGLDVNFLKIRDVWRSEILNHIRENYPDKQCLQCNQWLGHTLGESYCRVDGKIKHKIFAN